MCLCKFGDFGVYGSVNVMVSMKQECFLPGGRNSIINIIRVPVTKGCVLEA